MIDDSNTHDSGDVEIVIEGSLIERAPEPPEAVVVLCAALLAQYPLSYVLLSGLHAVNAALHTRLAYPSGSVALLCEVAALAAAVLYLLWFRGYAAGRFGLTLVNAHIDLILGPIYFAATFMAAVIVTTSIFTIVSGALVLFGWSVADVLNFIARAARREKEVMRLISTPFGMAFALGVVPVFEEFLFRGVLFSTLRRKAPFWAAAAIVSFAFSGLHFYLIGAPAVFVLSFACCLAFEKRKSLVPCVAMHFFWNLNAFILTGLRK